MLLYGFVFLTDSPQWNEIREIGWEVLEAIPLPVNFGTHGYTDEPAAITVGIVHTHRSIWDKSTALDLPAEPPSNGEEIVLAACAMLNLTPPEQKCAWHLVVVDG